MTDSLILDADQELLAETATQLFRNLSPLDRLRAYRDDRSCTGFDADLWQALAEQGWIGLAVPEEQGGVGLGLAELCLLMEAAGRQLATEPILGTVVMGAPVLAAGAKRQAHQDLLSAVLAGTSFLAVPWEQDLPLVAGMPLNARLSHVVDGQVADALILSAADGSWWCIPTDREGLSRRRDQRMDCRNSASFDIEGFIPQAEDRLETILDQEAHFDAVAVALAAEMLGGAEAAFEESIEYLKTRAQFGGPIGRFQALQHRAARLYIRLNLARSAVLAAARTRSEQARFASLAKASTSETFLAVAKEAVQFHGGIGMTDECTIGFYLKRAQGSRVMAGDEHHHRDRWARLGGY